MGENRDPLLAGLPHRVGEQTASRQAHLRQWWADLREGPVVALADRSASGRCVVNPWDLRFDHRSLAKQINAARRRRDGQRAGYGSRDALRRMCKS